MVHHHHHQQQQPSHSNRHRSFFRTPCFRIEASVRCHRHRGKLFFVSMSVICLFIVASIVRVGTFRSTMVCPTVQDLCYIPSRWIYGHFAWMNNRPKNSDGQSIASPFSPI